VQNLTSSANLKIATVEYTSSIVCREAARSDTATYKITVTNDYGTDSADIEVIVLGMKFFSVLLLAA
jgi:hypothetical protein